MKIRQVASEAVTLETNNVETTDDLPDPTVYKSALSVFVGAD
jgi:hypothetical protein